MISDLVDGETLCAAKFGIRETVEHAGHFASGLAAAHAAGIVHRNLNSDSVLVIRDRRARTLDFGFARIP